MTLVAHEFTVTRQAQWINSGQQVVEISQGGIDYTNPDALCKKYKDEFETFTGMTPAVEAAIKIAQAWQKDSKEPVFIGHGCTGGMTMPFDAIELTEENLAELRQHAAEFDEKLERCAHCGDILGKEKWGNPDIGEYDCCSQHCADEHYAYVEEDEEEDDEEE